METRDIKTAVTNLLTANNIEVKSVFIPFSQSRNKDEKNPSFNYLVTILKNGKEVLTTDYMMGCAHSPSYKKVKYNTVYGRKLIAEECERGYQLEDSPSGFLYPVNGRTGKKYILPDPVDVIWSLLMDSDVLNYANFEQWASEFGYNSDSRKGEKVYNECLQIALKLRQAIPDNLREELQELFQDY